MPDTPPRPATLAASIASSAVPFERLRERYEPFLQLARRLLGVAANCYPFMEIWPTSFRSYNVMLGSLSDMPFSLFGRGAPIGLRGLGMYASSRAANCMYCSAHCCVVAQRGGVDEATIAGAFGGEALDEGQRALVQVAKGMSTVPATLAPEDVRALRRCYRPEVAEGLALSVVMMGFLNKMMDAMGFDLEGDVAALAERLAAPSGWSLGRHRVGEEDRLRLAFGGDPTRLWLTTLPHLPGVILMEREWLKGVPTSPWEASRWLGERVGYDFPMIGRLGSKRAARAMAMMIRDNLRAEDSVLGLGAKHLAGALFARALGSEVLSEASWAMAQRALPGAPSALREAIFEVADEALDLSEEGALDATAARLMVAAGKTELDAAMTTAILLAKATATSPAVVPPALIGRSQRDLSAAALIELITWLSTLSLLHRLQVFQEADC